MKVSVDIETFSDVDIGKCGAYRYALSDSFDILLIAYAIDDQEVHLIDLATKATRGFELTRAAEFIALLRREDVTAHAFNAAFEHFCINVWLERMGQEPLPVSKWRCTQLLGTYCGYPHGLAAMGAALNLEQDKRKLTTGSALIRKFCVPQKPTKSNPNRTRIYPEDEPEKWNLFCEYNIQDVVTEREIAKKLSMWRVPDREQKLWELNEISNIYGVGIDMDVVEGALRIGDENTAMLLDEAKQISGLENPKSVQQLLDWLSKELPETEINDLTKATVADLLAAGVDSKDAEKMLQIRQQLGKTAAKKYDAMKAAVCNDSRIRGVTQFYGANRTGRYSGRLIQCQNLPQNHLEPLDLAREFVKSGDREMLGMVFGDPADCLGQLVRTALVPSAGKRFVVADYSAIEARVVAYLADEMGTIDLFKTSGKIYEHTASSMFNVPIETIVKGNPNYALRQRGKVATLACGYGGGVGALVSMGAVKMGVPEEELPDIRDRWRRANPNIVKLWDTYGKCAKLAITTGKPQYAPHGIVFRRETDCITGLDAMTIELPVGRKLFYVDPRIDVITSNWGKPIEEITYMGNDIKTHKWVRVKTFSGKLVENCLAEGTLVVTDHGIKPIETVELNDRVWDGSEWVQHEGLIDKGVQFTIQVDGLYMTPEHKILTTEGWRECGKSEGLHWAEVRIHDCYKTNGHSIRDGKMHQVAMPMRMWGNKTDRPEGHIGLYKTQPENVMRMHETEEHRREKYPSRDVKTSSLGRMALYEAEMHGTDSQSVEELRWSWHNCVRQMDAQLRKLLGRYGRKLQTGAGIRQDKQRYGIQSGKLPMDYKVGEYKESQENRIHKHPYGENDGNGICGENRTQHKHDILQVEKKLADRPVRLSSGCEKRVYDIRNCGERHCFTVYDPSTESYRLVHNCVQAVARDILTETFNKMYYDHGFTPVFSVHDEIIYEVESEKADETLQLLLDVMADTPKWCKGLPLKGAGFTADYYQKD